jgi:multidrug efflux system membrane fusion protein
MRATQKIILFSPLLVLLGCEKPQEPPAAPRPALVMTVQASHHVIASGIVGEIKPRFTSAQGFRVTGKIIGRLVEVGAQVKKGQILVKLDSTDANLAVQANQANIAAAEADLALAQANLERQRQLKEKKFISAAALDQYETAAKAAQARVQQSKAQTQVAGNQSRYNILMADRDGIVTSIRAEPGQVVEAGEVIVEVMDPKTLEVQIPVPESRMSQLSLKSEANMRLWVNRDKNYAVAVREISPAADPVTRTFLVKLDIQGLDAEVRPGMTATVYFRQTASADDTVLVPSTAIMAVQQQPIIWIVDAQNRVHAKNVEVASYREDGVLLKSGVTLGDKIVTAGVQALVEGQVIRPIGRAQ